MTKNLVIERRSKGDGFSLAMRPCSEFGTFGRKALLQSAEYSELGSLEQVSFISLLIHVAVQCFNPKARLYRIASLRSLQCARKWAQSYRIRGRKCLYILVKSLHGMAAAAVHLKAYHRRGCDLQCGSVLGSPCRVLESLPVGVTPTPTRGDNDIPARVSLRSIFCDVNSISSRGDNSLCNSSILIHTGSLTMRSPLRDRAPEE